MVTPFDATSHDKTSREVTSYETERSNIASLGGTPRSHQTALIQTKYHCSFAGCHSTSASRKDLKRHELIHSDPAKWWFCGCCQNARTDNFSYPRKDKVQTHLRNKHGNPKHEHNKGVPYPVDDCRTLFTAAPCLSEHLVSVHRDYAQDMLIQTAHGK